MTGPVEGLELSPWTLPGRLACAAGSSAPSDGICFIDRHEHETERSWSAVWAEARRAAGALAARGVVPGDRVALVLPTGPEVVFAILGCQLLGAVPFVLGPPPRLGRLDEFHGRTAAQLRAVDAAVAIVESRARAAFEPVTERHPPRLGVWPAEILSDGPLFEVRPVEPDAVALIQFSSGTTVDPKPVALTHRQIVMNCDACAEQLYVGDAAPVGVFWLPLHHDMGLIGGLFVAVCGGRRVALIPPEAFIQRPSIWLRALARHRGTYTAAPNFAYAYCVSRIADAELEGCDLSNLRAALCGAEPIAAEVGRQFSARFARWGLLDDAFVPVYGLAEATVAVCFSPTRTRAFRTSRLDRRALAGGRAIPGDDLELVSVGRPVRDVAIEVRGRDDGHPCAEGEVGRVWVRSPSLMAGYFGREDTPIRDGWLDTGDLGVLLDGELYVTGRAKDVVIIRGSNHMPQDIEEAAYRVPGVRPGCAAAVAELGSDGERLVLFVECREVSQALAEAVRRAVCATTGLDPAVVVPLEPSTLPRTTSGKIRRGETLRRWQLGELVPSST